MTPYDTFGALYDMQDFLTSYLDASFKGEVAQFALHTDRTETRPTSGIWQTPLIRRLI